jgi:hypothetical protein
MYVNQSLAGQTIQASSNFLRKDYLQTYKSLKAIKLSSNLLIIVPV